MQVSDLLFTRIELLRTLLLFLSLHALRLKLVLRVRRYRVSTELADQADGPHEALGATCVRRTGRHQVSPLDWWQMRVLEVSGKCGTEVSIDVQQTAHAFEEVIMVVIVVIMIVCVVIFSLFNT